MTRIHATCVARDGRGVLIAGPSGSGKSDLALRLIDRGWQLVSDDYTELAIRNGALIASAPPTIAGRIELRGVGILPLPALAECPIRLRIVAGVGERLPESQSWAMDGVTVPMLTLPLLEPSAPLKVERALELFA